ncbi:MAG: DNA repair protein RecO [Acidobacteria bacterium]|nr:DNA repair protein RecO [Acidobacteriota bacterium]
MPLHQTTAFILRTYPLSEAHKICVLLTRSSGLIRGVAHGARKMKSRFGASLEPFTEVSLTYHEKEGRELVNISNCEILHSYFHYTSKTENAAALSYLTELLCEFSPAHETNEKLYRLVIAIMEAMAKQSNLDSLLRYFEVWLLKISGFFPDLNKCISCNSEIAQSSGVWLAPDGAPQCYGCSGGRGITISSELKRSFEAMLRNNPANFAEQNSPTEHLNAIGDIAYRLIRRTLERDLLSYNLMNQVQAEIKLI